MVPRLENAVVAWTVVSGGGSVSAPTSLTDANGNASVTWTLGPAVGTRFPARSDRVGRVGDHYGDGDGGHGVATLTKIER